MKKILLLLLVCFSCSIYAQIDIQKSKYLNFLPSNVNPESLKPSDIPSEQVLRMMGLSEEEISMALDFKNSTGIFSEEKAIDSTRNIMSLSKFYENLGDTLVTDTIKFPIARIFGQDIFRNNSLSFYNKALDAKAPENYKVGSGDEITISVWGYSDFSETLLVDERGYISPSTYGRIYVKGLTFSKMRSLIKSRFSSFLDMKNSEIDVTLAYSRVITVNIVGEVYNPGSYTIPAINTAFNALIAAKGPNQLGSVRNIFLKREGQIVDSLDIYQFLFNPIRMPDIYMQDGDYLFIPPANNLVELKGAVKRPYTYEIKQGETVKDLINFAGGYNTNAFTDVVTLKRINYNTVKVYDIHKKHVSKSELQNGDEVVINQINSRLSNVVTIEGSIGVQGDYEFVKGERVLDLLKRAKCIDERTFLDKLYIIRLNQDQTRTHISISLDSIMSDPKHNDNILLNEYDILRVLSIDDFDDSFFVYVNGAVRKEGEYNYGDGMTLQDLLLQAGGLTQKAEGSRVEVSRIMEYDIATNRLKPKRTIVKSVKIGESLILSRQAKNFKLEPFDQIFVRENPNFESAQNIVLSGEVKYPGTYTLLSKDEKISSIIKRAGGLTDYAYLEGVKMFRKFEAIGKEKEEIKIDISDDLKNSIMADPFLSTIYENELRDLEKDSESESDNSTIFDKDLKEYVYDMVYLDLKKALSSNGSKHNLVLLENDSIIVPKIMDVVHITGELMNLDGTSISAPYFGARRANYYINNFAGGFTNKNRRSGTIVIYPNGITKQTKNLGLFKLYPKVKEGSTIKVVNKLEKIESEKKPIDWNMAIENTMLKLTAILSLWLLIDRVAPAN